MKSKMNFILGILIRPNGALQYAMDFLKTNIDWLNKNLFGRSEDIFIIDFPGQIELYICTPIMQELITLIGLSIDVCVIQMFDSFFCFIISLRKFQIHIRMPLFADFRSHISETSAEYHFKDRPDESIRRYKISFRVLSDLH